MKPELTLSFHMEKAMKEYIEKKDSSLQDTIKIGATNFAMAVADELAVRIIDCPDIEGGQVQVNAINEILAQLKSELQ